MWMLTGQPHGAGDVLSPWRGAFDSVRDADSVTATHSLTKFAPTNSFER
jgi:hypothetical protein